MAITKETEAAGFTAIVVRTLIGSAIVPNVSLCPLSVLGGEAFVDHNGHGGHNGTVTQALRSRGRHD